MKKEKYFKDHKFILLFLYSEDYFQLSLVKNFVVDSNGTSIVIAARSGEVVQGTQFLDDGIHVPVLGEMKNFDIYLNFMDSSDVELKERLPNQNDLKHVETILNVAKSKFSNKVMVLAYYDESDPTLAEDLKQPEIVSYKIGGIEVIQEFIFSNFLNELKSFSRKKINGGVDLRMSKNAIDNKENHKFDLSKSHLVMLDDHWYGDGGIYEEEQRFERYTYNINQNKVDGLKANLEIPDRVYQILTSEQKEIIDSQNLSIIKSLMDYIGIDVFSQELENYSEAARINHQSMLQAVWQSEMSDFAGHDGYIGDGIHAKD